MEIDSAPATESSRSQIILHYKYIPVSRYQRLVVCTHHRRSAIIILRCDIRLNLLTRGQVFYYIVVWVVVREQNKEDQPSETAEPTNHVSDVPSWRGRRLPHCVESTLLTVAASLTPLELSPPFASLSTIIKYLSYEHQNLQVRVVSSARGAPERGPQYHLVSIIQIRIV